MRSVQALIFSFTLDPASSMALAVASISATAISEVSPAVKGDASSVSVLPAASATSTRESNCCSNCSAFSLASFRFLSSSWRSSSSLRRRSWTCSTTESASCFMRSACVPHMANSAFNTSFNSAETASNSSCRTARSFCTTLRMFSVAACSCRCLTIISSRFWRSSACLRWNSSCWRFISSMRLRCSSIRYLFASSSRLRFSCACICCCCLICSILLTFSICCCLWCAIICCCCC
mmetsp:Transcript_29714/g.85494  ORF Transcript_29714/g.85494 Transcript_29714/m.85494 type:complete len:235 (+) Transcript_29714:1052-1756(+)